MRYRQKYPNRLKWWWSIAKRDRGTYQCPKSFVVFLSEITKIILYIRGCISLLVKAKTLTSKDGGRDRRQIMYGVQLLHKDGLAP